MIQSWQTDLFNLQLSLTVKPMFKYVGDIDNLRRLGFSPGDPTHVGAREAVQRITDLPSEVIVLSGDDRRTVEIDAYEVEP